MSPSCGGGARWGAWLAAEPSSGQHWGDLHMCEGGEGGLGVQEEGRNLAREEFWKVGPQHLHLGREGGPGNGSIYRQVGNQSIDFCLLSR